jgi:adenosylcobinamide-phosphate synthase
MIVGRDTASLGRGELSRAGVEAVAESLGDGVVAPLFWFAVFGLPGAFAYRISNTMDSMIGHKDERYLRFGWAAARFDDLLNYLPTRLMGFSCVLLAALCAKGPKAFAGAARAVRRCHAAHKSPNAGWYEAAFAGALGIRLGGVNYYCGERIEYPLMNPEGTQASPRSLREAVSIMLAAAFFSALLLDLCVLPLKLWLGGHI